MEKFLEFDKSVQQMQDVFHSKASEWKRCYRSYLRIYRDKLPEVQKRMCNSYLKSNRQGVINLISLMKSQRSNINKYNSNLLAHQFLLEIINEIHIPPE
ncbi:unnamed protein product [Schistosoma spindalis]|nr:unnamed protein product [Schistosoma spindale]